MRNIGNIASESPDILSGCGFAGDAAPHSIIPSRLTRKSGQTVEINTVANDPKELYGVLVDFLYHLYIRQLSVSPKDRRVVIVENMLSTTSVFRETIATVLFKHYEVSSVFFAPSHVVALYTLSVRSSLVVDLGATHTTIVPVFEWIPIIKAWQSIPAAASAVHQNLSRQLLESATVQCSQSQQTPLAQVMNTVPENILEDIKVRCCFVTKYARGQSLRASASGKTDEGQALTPPPAVDYPLKENKVMHITGLTRESACEILFEADDDGKSLATALLDAILLCPIDIRKTMAENLLLIGGSSMLKGLKSRLLAELRSLVKSPQYADKLSITSFKFHQAPGKENYISWLGASIFGSLETLANRSISREQYNGSPILPDWCSLYQPEEKSSVLGATKKLEAGSSTAGKSPSLSPSVGRSGLLSKSMSVDSKSKSKSPVLSGKQFMGLAKASSLKESNA